MPEAVSGRTMPSPAQALAACTRAAEERAADGTLWADAVHGTVRSLIDRLVASRGLPPTGLSYPVGPAADEALDALGPLDGWHIADIGEVHQHLLELTLTTGPDGGRPQARRESLGRRAEQGAWYTPPEIAEAMCRLSLGPQLARLEADPDPASVLDILLIDPACGAGVFLIAAAHLIAGRFAARVSGQDPAPAAHLRAALPVVMAECIHGIDIDPIAVDLAKTALWLEAGGRPPFTFLDRNIICGNPLDGDEPPAFTERQHTSTTSTTPTSPNGAQ
jgi:hypothetical protein